MVAITDGMNARDVCFLLAERNHQEQGPNWTIVEKIPDLYLGRKHVVCTNMFKLRMSTNSVL